YDDLAQQFNTELPAVGFALDIDTLLSGIDMNGIQEKSLSIQISYANSQRKTALSLANLLREGKYSVIITPLDHKQTKDKNQTQIIIDQQTIKLQKNNQTHTFKKTKDI